MLYIIAKSLKALNSAMSEFPENLLSLYYFIGATAGLASILFAYWNWRKDRPIIEPIILRSTHEGAKPTTVTVEFEVQNVGYRPTSLNELRVCVLDGSTELHGKLESLIDAREAAKIERPYRQEQPPEEFLDLPIVIGGGFTERLIASFRLDETITHTEAKCILMVRYTGGEKTAESTSRSRPLHKVSLPT